LALGIKRANLNPHSRCGILRDIAVAVAIFFVRSCGISRGKRDVMVAFCRLLGMAVALVTGAILVVPAFAQEPEPERCPRFVAAIPKATPASYILRAQAEESEVRLTYIGHSTFLIESPAGVTIATDYNDIERPAIVPEIVTMNRAHSSHFSFYPEPEIVHVLRGWGENGVPARHELTVRDVWIRNVTTNIRGGFGMSATIQRDMNSMFVFEVAGLCIAHLGHLHHPLTPDHLKALGRIDQFNEPFGLSVAEAMMCGTPVIAFNKGAMPELIQHEQTGFLVKNVSEAVEAVHQIGSISRFHCREWALVNFSQEKMVADYITVYKKLLQSGSRIS
jgi:hypothetical protein